jgi:hypothetical protein
MSNYRTKGRRQTRNNGAVPGLRFVRFVQFFTVLSGERRLGNLLGNPNGWIGFTFLTHTHSNKPALDTIGFGV